MANPHRGELTIKVGERSYVIQYTSNSLVELEDALDKGIMEIIAEIQKWGANPMLMRMKWVRALFWAGLRAHHPEVTLKSAGDMILEVENQAMGVVALTGEAMGMAFGVGTPESGEKTVGPQGPVNGTGTGSLQTTLPPGSTPTSSGTSPPGRSD